MKKQNKNILKVFSIGGAALIMSAAAMALTDAAGAMFADVTTMSGYWAVIAFAIALLLLAAALCVVYFCGCCVIHLVRAMK